MGLDLSHLLWDKPESNPKTTRIAAIRLSRHAVVLRYTEKRQNVVAPRGFERLGEVRFQWKHSPRKSLAMRMGVSGRHSSTLTLVCTFALQAPHHIRN
jgi:hypothetical protein